MGLRISTDAGNRSRRTRLLRRPASDARNSSAATVAEAGEVVEGPAGATRGAEVATIEVENLAAAGLVRRPATAIVATVAGGEVRVAGGRIRTSRAQARLDAVAAGAMTDAVDPRHGPRRGLAPGLCLRGLLRPGLCRKALAWTAADAPSLAHLAHRAGDAQDLRPAHQRLAGTRPSGTGLRVVVPAPCLRAAPPLPPSAVATPLLGAGVAAAA